MIFQHPAILILAAILCLPVLFPLGRFFFDDMETFENDIGIGSDTDRDIWMVMLGQTSPFLYMKIVGFVCVYAAVVLAAYQFFCKFV